jgi:hypothetical protein
MQVRKDFVIDATKTGNISRFINHSCAPNAKTQKWSVKGVIRIAFEAIKEIKIGEEITFDYNFVSYGQKEQICYCGAKECRGVLGKPQKVKKVKVEVQNSFEEIVLETELDILMLVRRMYREVYDDYQKMECILNVSRLFSKIENDDDDETRNVIFLCREFARLKGFQILKQWYETGDETSKNEILHILSNSNFKTQNFYKDSGWLELVETYNSAQYEEKLDFLHKKWKILPYKQTYRKSVGIKEMIEEETARAGIFDEIAEENLQNSFENVKNEEGDENGGLWGVGDAEQVKIMAEQRLAEKFLVEKQQKDQERISRRKILLEQVEKEKLMEEKVKQKAIEDEKLKKEKRIELKRKRYLDKINDQSKIAELDVFKPSLNIGAMRIEDKVARFFQSSQGVNDDAGTEFTQDSGLSNSGFGTTEHENFSLQEEASDYDEIAKAIDPHGKTSRAKLKLIRQVHATVTQRLWDDVTKAIEQMESHNAILPFNIIDSYSNLKKRIEDKNDDNQESSKKEENTSDTGKIIQGMTPDNIQQGEVLEPEAEELLPKHWKLAYDNSGKRYYYHELSRKSQWELPVEIIPEEIKILEKMEKSEKFHNSRNSQKNFKIRKIKSAQKAKKAINKSNKSPINQPKRA